ncbi:zinc finger domain-containing protein [Mortierella alpina]|nr:zinc finger domain-containing protein [Mortierella alpina]
MCIISNPINNNMCSKCFKEVSQKNSAASNNATSAPAGSVVSPQKQTLPELPLTQLAPAAASPPTSAPPAPTQQPAIAHTPSAIVRQPPQPAPHAEGMAPMALSPVAAGSSGADSPAPGERPVQANKGRCFMCRAKIPLAKQAINKCRCEYVFCDTHKALDKHDCDFDFAKMGKDLLTKANPKLNDKPRGGRSFTRLD